MIAPVRWLCWECGKPGEGTSWHEAGSGYFFHLTCLIARMFRMAKDGRGGTTS